jgi:Type I restriction enzyme R protein N terminus (HSDR_N)
MKIPKKVHDRLAEHLKTFQGIALSHKTRDVSEADTVTLVKDILAYMFGYDKYTELTSEVQIKGTYCDLAVKIADRIRYLIEVKAAGVSLNEAHLRQATAYGASQGIEWIVLTNGIQWRLYRIKFAQPLETEEISTFDLTTVNPRNEDDVRRLFLLCREGITSDAMDLFHQQAMLLNRYTVAQVLFLDPVLSAVRRELRRFFPDLKVDSDQIADLLKNDILKREVIEGEKVAEAAGRMKKAMQKIDRAAAKAAAITAGKAVPEDSPPDGLASAPLDGEISGPSLTD